MQAPSLAAQAHEAALKQLADLGRHKAIETPQAADCTSTFVVPVYNERPERVLRLVESLASQDGAGHREVILVVNNPPPQSGRTWKTVFDRNQSVLGLPIYQDSTATETETATTARIRAKLAVFAIDRSSEGCWVSGNNVGLARQVGLLESTLRAAARGVNTLTFHTDADCYFPDSGYAEKVEWLFGLDPALLAMAGTYFPELVEGDPEAKGVPEHIGAYKRYRRYRRLYRDITRGTVDLSFNEPITLGSSTIHRTFEGMMVGGFPNVNLEEDVMFGKNLQAYANERGMHLVHGRQYGLGPVTAFRISERTGASLSHHFQRLQAGEELLVDDAFNPGSQVILTDEYLLSMVNAVLRMPNGAERIQYLFVTSPLANLRIRRS